MAAPSRGSVNALVHPLKPSLEAIATLFFSPAQLKPETAAQPPAVKLHMLGRGQDATLVEAALMMALAVRGGRVDGVIFIRIAVRSR
jgi:hypothetical protein